MSASPLDFSPSRSAGSVKREIRRLNDAWNKASIKMDLDFINAFYADDCIFHFPNGQSADKRWVMKLLESGDVSFESIGNTDVAIEYYGSAVVWTAKAKLTEVFKGVRTTGEYLWLRVFALLDEKWRVVAFQSTSIQKVSATREPMDPSNRNNKTKS